MVAPAPRRPHSPERRTVVRLAVLHPPDLPEWPAVQAGPAGATPGLQLENWCAASAGLHNAPLQPPDVLLVRAEWFEPQHLDRTARQRTLLNLRLATPTTAWLIGWQQPGEEPLSAFDALQIRGTLQYPSDPDTLLDAAHAVLAGALWFPPEVLQTLYLRALAARQQPPAPGTDLTPQEQTLLGLMHRGLSPREIGRSLGMSRGRVQRSLVHALEKRAPW